MAKTVIVTADKIKKRERIIKYLKYGLFICFSLLLGVFIVLNFVYNGGKFSINLDKKLSEQSSIVLYSDSIGKDVSRKLFAEDIEYMDNISINWIPKNIDTEKDGSHNGENYIAYTFYLENQGEKEVNYWYTIFIDDVIKDVDEAVRIMVFKNGEKTVYAKKNAETKKPEQDTVEFYSDEIAVINKRTNFKSGDIDKYTVVIFLEGDDPDCVNKILGGEIKLHMEMTAEDIKEEK